MGRYELVTNNGVKKVRVVSMPCVELYDEQSYEFISVLPNAVRKRIVVTASKKFS